MISSQTLADPRPENASESATVTETAALDPSRSVGTPVDLGEPAAPRAVEIGGREGPEPTRFGDWERGGRCIDF